MDSNSIHERDNELNRHILSSLLPEAVKKTLRTRLDLRHWKKTAFASPPPPGVKRETLGRLGLSEGTWIETGTFLGDTTEFLSRRATMVHTIEPSLELFERAQARFANHENVSVHLGTSEDVLPRLLRDMVGDVSFWLDGHFSGGQTFEASVHTPIVFELNLIKEHLRQFGKVAVLVDDLRCFNPSNEEYRDYPPKDFLVRWAQDSELAWTIENDIFAATRT